MANSFSLRAAQVRQQLRVRYQGLERRDRLALTGLSIFFGGLILIYGVWLPANAFLESRMAARDRAFELLQYMRATEQEARTLGRSATAVPSGQDMLTLISRSVQRFNISPNRLQPEGDGVSVWFEEVAFDDLARWLQSQSEQGIVVRQLSVDRDEGAGRVNARIVLTR